MSFRLEIDDFSYTDPGDLHEDIRCTWLDYQRRQPGDPLLARRAEALCAQMGAVERWWQGDADLEALCTEIVDEAGLEALAF